MAHAAPRFIRRPSRVHQALVRLFERDPFLALECAYRIRGRPLPSAEDVALITRATSLPRPGLFIADAADDISGDVVCDLILSVHRRHPDGSIGESIELIWIMEVQLCPDISRAQAWSDAITAASRKFSIHPTNVHMLIVCPDPGVRSWLQNRLLSRMQLKPILLTRTHVPRLHDASRLARRPEPAVLSVAYHGRDPRCLGLVRMALRFIEPIRLTDEKTYQDYRHLIRTATGYDMDDQDPDMQHPDMQHILEGVDFDDIPDDEPVSRWEFEGLLWNEIRKRVHERGREEGRKEGREEGREEVVAALQDALMTMLELRGLPLGPGERATVLRCEDPGQLRLWIAGVKDCRQTRDLLVRTR